MINLSRKILQSAAVQRIDDVAVLKSHQFPEDAGPCRTLHAQTTLSKLITSIQRCL